MSKLFTSWIHKSDAVMVARKSSWPRVVIGLRIAGIAAMVALASCASQQAPPVVTGPVTREMLVGGWLEFEKSGFGHLHSLEEDGKYQITVGAQCSPKARECMPLTILEQATWSLEDRIIRIRHENAIEEYEILEASELVLELRNVQTNKPTTFRKHSG